MLEMKKKKRNQWGKRWSNQIGWRVGRGGGRVV